MQNKLQTRGLIQIISQLPNNSIIRINNQSIRNDYVFNFIKDYEIKFDFSTCTYLSGVFIQIDKSNIQTFIQILENVNVSKYLIDSEYFVCQETYWEPLAAVYRGLFCISDKIKLSEEFITQCEENDIAVQDMYIPLQQYGLIQIFSQLPNDSILAIDSFELEDCSAFQTLEKFRINIEFNHQHNEFSHYYQINKENLVSYMDLIRNSDLPSFLIHFAIFSNHNELLLSVYDCCIFCISSKICIKKNLYSKPKRFIYISKIYNNI